MRKMKPSSEDFADELGPGYFNLVVRRLAQRMAAAGDAYMRQIGVTTPATSTAILTYIARRDRVTIADIAQALGYTHQAVAKAVGGLERSGLVRSSATADDRRKRLLSLTRRGRQDADRIEAVAARAALVFSDVFDEIGVDVFKALRALETALDRRPLAGRLAEQSETPGTSHLRPKRARVAG